MDIFGSFTPLVEPLSLDEAFLDVPGLAPAARPRAGDRRGDPRPGAGRARAHLLGRGGAHQVRGQARVRGGQAAARRPTGPTPGLGVKVVTDDDLLAFLHPLPVQALWGVGPATLAKLERLGIATVGRPGRHAADRSSRRRSGRRRAATSTQLANGIDDRPVEPDRQAKSIGHEETFVEDRHERADLERELVRFADAIGTRLRQAELAGRTVTIKVRFGDFRTITALRDPEPSRPTRHQVIRREARQLLDGVDPGIGVRLLGVSVSGLTADSTRQLSLDDVDGPDWTEANRAIDEIRERFGARAIGPAVIAGADGLQLKRKGEPAVGARRRGLRLTTSIAVTCWRDDVGGATARAILA